jgi:hypothetical protein
VEERAQLLQFTTGTSRVPVQGFKALQVARCRCRCRCMCARARAFVRARASVLLTRGVRAGLRACMRAWMAECTPQRSAQWKGASHSAQGVDGSIKPFCVEGVRIQDTLFPRAHTCFKSAPRCGVSGIGCKWDMMCGIDCKWDRMSVGSAVSGTDALITCA